jgi:hypothetical protein
LIILQEITKIDFMYKKHPDALRENNIVNQAKREVLGFEELMIDLAPFRF